MLRKPMRDFIRMTALIVVVLVAGGIGSSRSERAVDHRRLSESGHSPLEHLRGPSKPVIPM